MTAPANHYGIAEQGKLFALAGDHERAVAYYRVAMRLAATEARLSLCRRHYADCTMESLERMGAFDEAVRLCEQIIAHYRARPPQDELQARDLAAAFERCACLELKQGRREAALAHLRAATEAVAPAPPLAAQLRRHLESGLHLNAEYLDAAQQRHRYFCVRREQVDEARAVRLPDAVLFAVDATASRRPSRRKGSAGAEPPCS